MRWFDNLFLHAGGGSGHEPAHGGFVGQGMLTAAVSGDFSLLHLSTLFWLYAPSQNASRELKNHLDFRTSMLCSEF